MTKDQRTQNLMPWGIPRYIRCYDNHGKTADRYTVIFHGRAAKIKHPRMGADQWPFLGMDEKPFHPQGIGMHGHSTHHPADALGQNEHYRKPPPIGCKNHLGTRIQFQELPPDCKKLVIQDYKAIWNLN
jgi:hypothetical protein